MTKKTHNSILSVMGALIVLTAACLLLTACGCKHEWKDVSCAAPKTCTLCGETEGEPLPHTWVDANCETAKTCSVCNKTEGEPLGHTWTDANCETAKTCSVCNKTEGEPLGHTWVDATCETVKTCSVCKKTEGEPLGHKWVDATTEAPKTCSVCKKTEGERIITDSRFTTAACKEFFGDWKGFIKASGAQIGIDDFTGTMGLTYTITFNPNGTYKETIVLTDKAAFLKDLEDYYVNTLYAAFAGQGLNKEQADAAMKAQYNMDVKAYAKVAAAAVDWDAMFAASASSGVYYVSGGKIYSGADWDAALGSDNYTIKDGKLTLESLTKTFPGLEFTRVS